MKCEASATLLRIFLGESADMEQPALDEVIVKEADRMGLAGPRFGAGTPDSAPSAVSAQATS